MHEIVLAAALFGFPALTNQIVEDVVRSDAMLAVAMNMVPDFDGDPNLSFVNTAWIGLLSSRDQKDRAKGVQYISLYLLLKQQTEGCDTFVGTSFMMRKTFGDYLDAVKGGLERNLDDSDAKIRGIAAASLLTLDPRHKKAATVFLKYVEKLDDLDAKERDGHELAFTVSLVPPELSIPTLKRMLACEKEDIRRVALQAILLVGDGAKELSPTIAKLLVKRDPAIFGDLPILRIGFPANENLALLGLGVLDTRAAKAVPVLLESIKSGNAPKEPEVYHLLGKISGESKEVADCLRKAMKNSPEEAKYYAASGLAYAHPDDTDALRLVVEGLKSKDSSTQKLAMKACARIGARAKPAMPTLIKMFKDTKDEKRLQEISDIFSLIGPNAAEAVPDLKRELQAEHSDSTICDDFAQAIARIGGKGQSALAELLVEKEGYGAHEASKAFGDLAEKPTSATVMAFVNHLGRYEWAAEDCFTLISIGKLGTQAKEALPTLKKAAKSGKKYQQDPHGLFEVVEPYARWAIRRVSEEFPKPNPIMNKLAVLLAGRTKPVETVFSHSD